jgi:tetratricopeptide (TPR) repeat protein
MPGATWAGDKPLYAPAPAWVKPAPAIDVAKLDDSAPVVLVRDQQDRLEKGQVWYYNDLATRIASNQVLTDAGTIKVNWDPAKGDLIIHRAEILRGNEHIDLIAAGQRFEVLRREEDLERLQINGILTATLAVQGLRIGDVLHLTFSQTNRDDALKGNVQATAALVSEPSKLQFGRVRMIWPEKSDIHWSSFAKDVTPVLTKADGYQELTVTMPVEKPPEMPIDAPLRFRPVRMIEASSFDDWQSVSRVMAPLYRTQGTIAAGSPLAQEVATIAAASTDQRVRAAMALRLVQDKVRYLFNGMEGGNYVPQSPAQTWSLRYGDCKAKTLLLLAILHELGIEAEPSVVNSRLGDIVSQRLPTPGAFDHIIVHATIAGKELWLDGTGAGARIADLDDTPPFHVALPIREAGSGLVPITMRPDARPDVSADIELDQSAGIQFPAPYKIKVTFRGATADALRLGPAQLGQERVDQMTRGVIGSFLGNITSLRATTSYNEADGTATITGTGLAYPIWGREDERFKTGLDRTVEGIRFNPDRGRPAWRDIPVAMGSPTYTVLKMRLRLPEGGKGFTLEGSQQLPAHLAGYALSRTASLSDGWISIEDRLMGTGAEVPPADIAATRAQLADARLHLLRGVAPAGYPQRWSLVESGKKAHKFDAILADYGSYIDEKPTEAERYVRRAIFLASIYDRAGAVQDLDRAIAIAPSVDLYRHRAALFDDLGQSDKALADLEAARAIDPGSGDVLRQLASLHEKHGKSDQALELIADHVAAGGKEKNSYIELQADILAESGKVDEAVKVLDDAIAASPGNPDLLNQRCWLKGTHNFALDTALKDCTKAIELSDGPEAALDSRAMVYFRMNRYDDALADLNAALDRAPELPASMYLRGIIRSRTKDPQAAADLSAARMMNPQIDERYGKWGIKP